ncbi:MAG: MMPL family transporter [Pseudomonadales bacterium]
MESGPYFSREKMVAGIRQDAQQIGFAEGEVQVTGMMVLFNNMLKQLFNSQTSTLAYVLLATFVMFALLLRSLNLALIGLLPNVIAAATVIAFMGYAAIPLDMMTITIAAISIGIGVDDAIHYLHRFREEYAATGDVLEAVKRSHESIGRAALPPLPLCGLFSVLAFSNFVPTIYFG